MKVYPFIFTDTERVKVIRPKVSNQERKRGFWENLFKLQERLILKGLSNAASAAVEPLKLNAMIESSRQGRPVFNETPSF